MNDIDEVILIIEIFLTVVSLIFGGVLFTRYKALQTVAQQNFQSYSRKIKNGRILIQLLNLLVYVTLIVIQISGQHIIGSDENASDKLYAFLWVSPIVIGIWQIDIENLEFKSKIPLMIYHKIYWALQMVISIGLVLYLLIKEDASEHFPKFIVFLSMAAVETILVVYFFFRRQDIQEFMDLSYVIWDLEVDDIRKPLMIVQSHHHNEQTPDQSAIVESEINVTFYTGYTFQNNILQFKMKVILNPRRSSSGTNFLNQIHYTSGNTSREYILTKEYSEFIQLQEDLNEEIRKDIGVTDSALHDIDEINVLCSNNVQLEFNQIQDLRNKLIELMKVLCCNPNFYYQCFLDFLKIEEMDLKHYFLELKGNNPKRQNKNFKNRQESIHNQTQSFSQERWNSEFFEVIFDKIEDVNKQFKP